MVEKMKSRDPLKTDKKPNKHELAVIVDTWYEKSPAVKSCIDRVLATTNSAQVDTYIIAITHKGLDPEASADIEKSIKKEYPGKASTVVVDKYTYAYAYARGLQEGAEIADEVIELDSGGSHQPEEIPRFLDALKNNDIALSTRFVPGAINKFPWQRRAVSKFGTVLSNMFLGTHLTDATSGFEAFSSEVLTDIFNLVPPEKFLSVTNGPTHMFQTEIRAIASLLAKAKDYSMTEVKISYGLERVGGPFPIKYLIESLKCFYLLNHRIARLKKELNV